MGKDFKIYAVSKNLTDILGIIDEAPEKYIPPIMEEHHRKTDKMIKIVHRSGMLTIIAAEILFWREIGVLSLHVPNSYRFPAIFAMVIVLLGVTNLLLRGWRRVARFLRMLCLTTPQMVDKFSDLELFAEVEIRNKSIYAGIENGQLEIQQIKKPPVYRILEYSDYRLARKIEKRLRVIDPKIKVYQTFMEDARFKKYCFGYIEQDTFRFAELL